MGYQALLFCPDEKLARVVTQVFAELDFHVELVNEPFSAVKKLMAQRFDAVVVDCENEQNATLIFKSARNSSSNQSSLALALVEGQAGVAKAYRIGANLVLTKPINVEQAKGTLRVARGLLRKSSDAAAPASPSLASPAVPLPPESAPTPESQIVWRPAPLQPQEAVPEFESAHAAVAASAKVAEVGKATYTPEAKIDTSPAAAAAAKIGAAAPEISTAAASVPVAGPAVTHGAAAAPAPAKQASAAAAKKAAAPHGFESSSPKVQTSEVIAVPTFSALDDEEASERSGGGKKFLAIAAVVLLAGLAYFGWTKFGKSAPSSQPTAAIQTPVAVRPSVPSPAPSTGSVTAKTTPATTTRLEVAPAAPAGKASATDKAVTTLSIDSTPEIVTKKMEPPPLRVKSAPSAAKSKARSEETASQIPNPLAVASENDTGLNGLVPETANLPKAVETVKISQGVSEGLLIKKVQPTYPLRAKSMHIQGAVLMDAIINQEGHITNLKVLKGDPMLAQAAKEAVRQWRYKPYYLDGKPVDIQTQITVNFKLPN